ncbi:MAG: adenylate/guanylate cyclase domain-containing protein [Dehalococcoidia bacterium]|nr:adenylate/guanylate cyclase domain-containing protein [Dehalococcoidia bacterium]
MEQQIRFCTTSDGVRIAYATAGQGPPLVLITAWVGHLQFEWSHAETKAFYEGLANGRLLVRFDKRGTGLSDRQAEDFSVEARLRDLEAVVDALRLKRFALMGFSESGPTAIIYAARHPERVTNLVIYGSYHRWPYPAGAANPVMALIRSQWGMGSAALSAIFVPSGDPAQVAWWTELQRVSASPESAASIFEVNTGLDVTSVLSDIRAPALVIHRNNDTVCPFDVAREMAALIPAARFEPLEGDIHPPMFGDTAAVLNAVDSLLPSGARRRQAVTAGTPSGLVTILYTDMEGSTPLTQRLGDAKAQEVLRAHNTIVREALKAHGGSEIKHTGDGVMASFPTASGALECAIAVQQGFAAHNESAETPVRVRIGLNAGEPVAEEEDLFGTAVQLAARVCARAEPGQVLASNVVRELAAGKGFLFSDQGDVVLRGFEDPVRLYEVRWQAAG